MKEISIWFVIDVIIKKIWFIIAAVAIVAGATFVYNYNFVKPTYTASSAVIGSNGAIGAENYTSTTSGKINNTEIAASLNMVESYVDIMKTYSFYEYVAKQDEISSYSYSAMQIMSMTTIERRSDTSLFIDIVVNCPDAKHAITITNCISSAITEYMPNILQGAKIVQADKCIAARLVSNTVRNTLLMGFVAAVVTATIFIVFASIDNAVKGEESLQGVYEAPVLGVVPSFETNGRKSYKSYKNHKSYKTDAAKEDVK